MPDFWQFPTGSMGIGPSMRSTRRASCATSHTGPAAGAPTAERRGVGLLRRRRDGRAGVDGRALPRRARGLDNCTFVINCNLQRLDGPVRGNGHIVDELESALRRRRLERRQVPLWGYWDLLFARDHGHALMRAFAHTVDGQFQTLSANDGAFNRRVFFGENPELGETPWSSTSATAKGVNGLRPGGHDADPRRPCRRRRPRRPWCWRRR